MEDSSRENYGVSCVVVTPPPFAAGLSERAIQWAEDADAERLAGESNTVVFAGDVSDVEVPF